MAAFAVVPVNHFETRRAEFQDSCRLAIHSCLALDFEDPSSYIVLWVRQTTRMGFQDRAAGRP